MLVDICRAGLMVHLAYEILHTTRSEYAYTHSGPAGWGVRDQQHTIRHLGQISGRCPAHLTKAKYVKQ